ncbi:MAG: terminase TerL endonuclease subunit [Oenococcus sp.]|uniref:terminase large subunit n=1 Tax=Oenococcus sp. TaxID=1979414 RepID=UPI0039E7F7EF
MQIDLTQTHDVLGAYQSIDFDEIRKKYQDEGTQYAFDVLDGKYTTGYHLKLACFRHLRDLQRQGNSDFPFHYSVKSVDNILKFAAICPEVKTLKPVNLQPFQKFIMAMAIGWKMQGGDRRFSRVIVSVGRHQGKTFLLAIIMIYSFLVESIGQASQDFLISSINFKQTSKLLSYVKTMLRQILLHEPWKTLGEQDGINIKSLATQSDMITMSNNENKLRAITWASGQYDSFHFKIAVGDEFADPDVNDVDKIAKITSGQVDVDDKQFIQISTAYPDSTVPFHRDEKRIIQAMEEDYKRDGDEYLCLIWDIDHEDETYQPEMWAKANPLLDMPEKHDKMLRDLITEKNADSLAGNIRSFQNKSLNIWLSQSVDSFLNLKDVERSITKYFDIKGRLCYLGFDFSQFSDNTAVAFVFPYVDDKGKQKFHIYQHSFIPWQRAGSLEAKIKQDGIDYRALADKGFCSITGDEHGIINVDQVYNWLIDFVEQNELDVKYFGYDRWGSFQTKQLVETLDANTSWMTEDIHQLPSELANPTKYLQQIFVTGKVSRYNDPILEKSLLNAVMKSTVAGIAVDKDKATLKIDVVDALIDAFYRAMHHFDVYSDLNDPSKAVDRMTAEQVKAWFDDPNSGLLGG